MTLSLEDVRDWYNGYIIGSHTVYNPWSIISCLYTKGKYEAHWVNTSENVLIKDLLQHSTPETKSKFERLLQWQPIEESLEPHLTFADLAIKGDLSLWSFLVLGGYLTAGLPTKHTGIGSKYRTLHIPTKEVHSLFEGFIRDWFTIESTERYHDFLNSLITGDAPRFQETLHDYLHQTASFYDFSSKTPEQIYHVEGYC